MIPVLIAMGTLRDAGDVVADSNEARAQGKFGWIWRRCTRSITRDAGHAIEIKHQLVQHRPRTFPLAPRAERRTDRLRYLHLRI